MEIFNGDNDDSAEQTQDKDIKVKRIPLADWKVRYVHRYNFIKQVGQGAYGAVYKASMFNETKGVTEYFALK